MRTDRCCNFLRENAGDDVASVQLHPNVLVLRCKITAFYGFPQSLYLGIFTLLPSKTRLMIDIFVGLFCLETTIGVGLVWLPVGAHLGFRPTCWGVPLLFGFGLSFSRAHARENDMLLRWNSQFITRLLHQTAHECICVKALSRNVPRFEENVPHFEENLPRFKENLPHVGEYVPHVGGQKAVWGLSLG